MEIAQHLKPAVAGSIIPTTNVAKDLDLNQTVVVIKSIKVIEAPLNEEDDHNRLRQRQQLLRANPPGILRRIRAVHHVHREVVQRINGQLKAVAVPSRGLRLMGRIADVAPAV